VLPPHFFGHLVAGHRQQQLDQIVGLFQIVLAGGHTHEEAAEHRLTNVHWVEFAPPAGVPETGAQDPADDRLEVAHEPGGRLFITAADPADEFVKRGVWRHQSIPLPSSRPVCAPPGRTHHDSARFFLSFLCVRRPDSIEESGAAFRCPRPGSGNDRQSHSRDPS
jgi:hypothetical protein